VGEAGTCCAENKCHMAQIQPDVLLGPIAIPFGGQQAVPLQSVSRNLGLAGHIRELGNSLINTLEQAGQSWKLAGTS